MSYPDFVCELGFDVPDNPLWSLHIEWSTRRPVSWVLERNRLEPQHLQLTLSLSASSWRVALHRHDDLFKIHWGEAGLYVDAQPLRYRRLTPWPEVLAPGEAAGLVPRLESVLNVSFEREVNVQGSLADQILAPSFDDGPFRRWLAPSADDWSVFEHRR